MIVKLNEAGLIVHRAEIPDDHGVWDGYVLFDGQPDAPPPVPQVITRRQRNLWLGANRVMQIKAAISAISDPTEKHHAAVHFNDAESTERHHPLTIAMAAIVGLTEPEQIDQAFIEASQL